MAEKDKKEEFGWVQVEKTEVIDVSNLDISGDYTEDKLKLLSTDELHYLIKNNDLPKETLKLIKKIIKQKKHER